MFPIAKYRLLQVSLNIAINMQFAFTNRSSLARGKLLLNIHTVDIST